MGAMALQFRAQLLSLFDAVLSRKSDIVYTV